MIFLAALNLVVGIGALIVGSLLATTGGLPTPVIWNLGMGVLNLWFAWTVLKNYDPRPR